MIIVKKKFFNLHRNIDWRKDSKVYKMEQNERYECIGN